MSLAVMIGYGATLQEHSLSTDRLTIYSVNQKNCPDFFLTFFLNGWEFLVQIYYKFLSTLDYKFLFNYLQL